jgi:predicted HicB family RNase H-like nuclease
MKYKNYEARVSFDDEAGIFHGEVIGIRDVITFQGESVAELRKAFAESVDDYLAFCVDRGEEPDKPFSGRFVLRIKPELHKQIYLAAKQEEKSLNTWIEEKLLQESPKAKLKAIAYLEDKLDRLTRSNRPTSNPKRSPITIEINSTIFL